MNSAPPGGKERGWRVPVGRAGGWVGTEEGEPASGRAGRWAGGMGGAGGFAMVPAGGRMGGWATNLQRHVKMISGQPNFYMPM